jgi:hypothetical protein
VGGYRSTVKVAALLPLVIVLAACQTVPVPPREPVVITSIDGRIVRASLPDEVSFSPIENLPQERVPVGPDGTFSLPLPESMEGQRINWASANCNGAVTETDPSARFEELTTLRIWAQDISLGSIRTRTNTTERMVEYLHIYSSARTVIRGRQVCPIEGDSVYNFDMSLGRGWNVVRFTYDRVQPPRYTYESVDAGTLPWY